jgi:hypothetical protein
MAGLRLAGILLVLITGWLMLAAPPAAADPVNPFLNTSATTELFYSQPCCTAIFDPNGGPGAGSSSVTNTNPLTNGVDSVSATSDPGRAGIGNFAPMGVDASLMGGDVVSASASADYNDAWFCSGHCGVTGVGIDTFLSVQGTASDVGNNGFIELDVDFIIAGSDLHFTYSQDAGSGPPEAIATVNGVNIATVSASPVTLTQDPTTKDWTFSLTLASDATVCTFSDACESGGPARICGQGGNCPFPSFSTDESVSLEVDGEGTNLSLDASDPIGFTFDSTDPNTQFFSSSGFLAPAIAIAAVPEPNSVAMLATGLAVLIWRRRRSLGAA